MQNITNSSGWHTSRKLLVIESDDWGMTRMASKDAYKRLLQKRFPVDKCEYNSNDALESNMDMELLLEVLYSVKDKNGNPAIITTNNILANPDFEKIKASGFTSYFFEPFTETLKAYPAHSRVYDLHKEGITKKMLRPQLHGREHINIFNWLKALQQNDKEATAAFEERMFTVSKGKGSSCKKEWLDGFGAGTIEELSALDKIIEEACNLFEKNWGFRSASVIAPCYTWHSQTENTFFKNGIKIIQGGRMQRQPILEQEGYKYKRHYAGQQNSLGQVYLVRNAEFEPSSAPSLDWVSSCLKEIKNAFFWGKPAIISAHRLNFIGFINEKNRENNLKAFKTLLTKIITLWPDVEFSTSDAVGEMILNSASKKIKNTAA